jgi:hypothetical protein
VTETRASSPQVPAAPRRCSQAGSRQFPQFVGLPALELAETGSRSKSTCRRTKRLRIRCARPASENVWGSETALDPASTGDSSPHDVVSHRDRVTSKGSSSGQHSTIQNDYRSRSRRSSSGPVGPSSGNSSAPLHPARKGRVPVSVHLIKRARTVIVSVSVPVRQRPTRFEPFVRPLVLANSQQAARHLKSMCFSARKKCVPSAPVAEDALS